MSKELAFNGNDREAILTEIIILLFKVSLILSKQSNTHEQIGQE